MGYLLIILGLLLALAGTIIVARGAGKNVNEQPVDQPAVVSEPEASEATAEKKGKAFEDYIVRLLNKSNNMTLQRRNADRLVDGTLDKGSLDPDLLVELKLERKSFRFAIECKWRSSADANGEVAWSNRAQRERYIRYARKNDLVVFVALGIGGDPGKPDQLYIIPIDKLASHTCNLGDFAGYAHALDAPLYYNVKTRTLR